MELLKNTLYINLEHRTDRLEHVKLELAKVGIEGERVNAVKAKIGAIGCTLSHIRCLELAKQREYDQVFICEDDITFTDPKLLIKNLTKFHEEDGCMWDMIIIGGNNVPPYQRINSNCVRVFYCQTTTGYIVKKSYYDTLIKNFKESASMLMKNPTEEGKKKYALDIYWKKLQMQDFWYMITPPTVTQYENYSDIEERHTDYKHLMLDMEKEWYFAQFKQN
uniref:Glycosyl transferase family 25 domain-containing protein n=1 Tax=viral metagenome TaxID=1070528 RepID=A0A6C0JJH9_9ZZZZ